MTHTQAVSVRQGVLTLTLNRPAKLSAPDGATADALIAELRRTAADEPVRVVLTGTGRAFGVGAGTGADLPVAELLPGARVTRSALGVPTANGAVPMLDRANPPAVAVAAIAVPVVAAVSGLTAGLGCSLALACDLVLTAGPARVPLGFAPVGLVPDGGATLALRDRPGPDRALGIALLGDALSSAAAREAGWANRVFADEVEQVAMGLFSGPSATYRSVKALVRAGARPS